jgi:hypothetical protein
MSVLLLLKYVNVGGFFEMDTHLTENTPWPDFEGRCAPPLRSFCTPEKSFPLGKVSMIDQSENFTFFGCLSQAHTLRF